MANILDGHIDAYSAENPYDFDNGILLRWYAQRVVALTDRADSALELGLGHGYTAEIFSNHFTRYTVLEGSPAVVGHYRQRFQDRELNIVETYFEQFTSAATFDVIVMGFVLEHVDDPAAILARFRELLAPAGRLFVAVPNAEGLNRRLGHLAGMLPDMQTLSDNDILLGHKRYYTVDSLSQEVKNAGYAVARLEGVYLKPLTTAQMIACQLPAEILRALCEVGVQYPELSCGILAELKRG